MEASNDHQTVDADDLHLVAGILAKAFHFRQGQRAPQHSHAHDHISVVARGFVELTVDGVSSEHGPGSVIHIAAGKEHWVRALTQATWLCIWNADHYPLPDEVTP